MDDDLDLMGRILSQRADRMIAELHAAIRCRCCPDGLFTRHLAGAGGAEPGGAPRRALSRADFLGLLAAQDIDAGLGNGAR